MVTLTHITHSVTLEILSDLKTIAQDGIKQFVMLPPNATKVTYFIHSEKKFIRFFLASHNEYDYGDLVCFY